jgi:hypothetical protein
MKNNNLIQKTAMLMLTTLLAFHLSSLTMAASDDIPDLSGFWGVGRCPDGTFMGCNELAKDDEKLSSRARAYQAAIDEHAQPKYDCAPMAVPHLHTDPYNYRIEQLEDRVNIYYAKDDVVRTIWLIEHDHPEPRVSDFFIQGHSHGWYEDGALVIETDKFTFDPQGLNADFQIPSSTQKQVTERFKREGNNLAFSVTTIDTLFLLEPWTYEVVSTPVADLGGEWICSVRSSRHSLRFVPLKYKEDPTPDRLEYLQD